MAAGLARLVSSLVRSPINLEAQICPPSGPPQTLLQEQDPSGCCVSLAARVGDGGVDALVEDVVRQGAWLLCTYSVASTSKPKSGWSDLRGGC